MDKREASAIVMTRSARLAAELQMERVLLVVRAGERNSLLANASGYAAIPPGMDVDAALKTSEPVYVFLDGAGAEFCAFTQMPMNRLRRPVCAPLAKWMIGQRAGIVRTIFG